MGPGGAMNAVVTPELLIFALAFSVFLGLISGVIPARTAAKMKLQQSKFYTKNIYKFAINVYHINSVFDLEEI